MHETTEIIPTTHPNAKYFVFGSTIVVAQTKSQCYCAGFKSDYYGCANSLKRAKAILVEAQFAF